MLKNFQITRKECDILIVGGGTAGCFAAIKASAADENLSIIVAEKASIERSGCLAAGVNALNAYITKGHEPSFYADYAMNDACGIADYDLLLSMSERLNRVTADLEKMGLVILKDKDGNYVTRGSRNIKINGENIKPILAAAVRKLPNVEVIEHFDVADLIRDKERVSGAWGIKADTGDLLFVNSKAILIATGGAAGIYKPNNPGFSRHKMWYCPFDTGAGYAMGIRAGAEMTSFEMRFIALRCKDTIAPTGTLAQGVGAKQVNSLGEVYEDKYGLRTSERVYGTTAENEAGRGPCFLATKGISRDAAVDLLKAYLNMNPSQTLKWIASGKYADEEDVQIEGSEPYIVGGHTGSGFFVNRDRETTLKGLYAAGDVAGNCPQKYVTGALAEGEIAALSMVNYVRGLLSGSSEENSTAHFENENDFEQRICESASEHFNLTDGESPQELEAKMQDIMDKYAGGISTNYAFTEKSLDKAGKLIDDLIKEEKDVRCETNNDYVHFLEVRERLTVARVLIEHLKARKETRWHCFDENRDYPFKDEKLGHVFINSVTENGKVRIIERKIHERPDK